LAAGHRTAKISAKGLDTDMKRFSCSILFTIILSGGLVLPQLAAQGNRPKAGPLEKGAPSARIAAGQRTARYFDSIKDDPPALLAFLKAMPKGADLHNHLSGAVYAEDYIRLATANHLCVSPNGALALPPCPSGQRIDEAIRANSGLYDKLIDAWSMRNWQLSGESGHDHFFAAFGKFGAAINDDTFGDMLAAALNQAASDHVSYVELMFTPNSANIRKIAQGRWNDDFASRNHSGTGSCQKRDD
jgi:hypothetical protein